MFSYLINKLTIISANAREAARAVKCAFPYELIKVTSCSQTGRHLLEIKITGKSQGAYYLAEDVASDDGFISLFSPRDISVICYLAACDKYEKILEEENVKKTFELLRGSSRGGGKSIQLRNKINGEISVISLREFSDKGLIESLESKDVYQIGYLAGQEQTLKDVARLKILAGKKQ